MKHIKLFEQFLNESKIPVLTKKSTWGDIESYLKWLSQSQYNYHIDDDPEDIFGDKKVQKALRSNADIMWGYNDRPANKSISDTEMMNMLWDAYPMTENKKFTSDEERALKTYMKHNKASREEAEAYMFSQNIGGAYWTDLHKRLRDERYSLQEAQKIPAKIQTLADEIKDDFSSFRPGSSYMQDDAQIEDGWSNIIAQINVAFRDLGKWQPDYGDEDEEDNDNEIWVRGEYAKYEKKFEDWAKGHAWYKKNKAKIKLDINTGEKNWAYFIVKIMK